WRWALGDMPFVNEEDLSQIPSLLVYPLVKLFAVLRDYDVTGLVLYGRHLYLLMALGVAVAAFVVLRRLVRWELSLPIAAMCVAALSRDTPQLSSTTMAASLLTLGAVLGLRAVIAPPARGWALASGVALGLAIVAYPTLLFVAPFYAVFLAFAFGRRVVAMVSQGAFAHPPDPLGPPTGHTAWLVLSAWALGGALTLLPVSLVILSFGPDNLVRAWRHTLAIGRDLGQLGGATKAYEVVSGLWSFIWSAPYLVLMAIVVYVLYRQWPTLGRALLAGLPLALWLAGQRPGLGTAGFVLIYAALAPYLYLFVPRERRPDGAKVLVWVWMPALFAGAMAAYTSSLGYIHAAMGVFPGVLVSALFLAWALESASRPRNRAPWLALVVLIAILGVSASFQFRLQAQLDPRAATRFTEGPWWGISVPAAEHAFITRLASDLADQERSGDRLLVFYGGSGLYLLWHGQVATNSYWIRQGEGGEMGELPAPTLAYFRRQHKVPTVAVHFLDTTALSAEELRAGSGGLDYPAVLVRPGYAVHRKPAGETVDDVLDGLPR
ncbi:MAG TPA: hypothetical protein VFH61_15280, partial [Thermoleophilia bacterium]|nr:hypothetical protein [Thermoleophilia bacterium]